MSSDDSSQDPIDSHESLLEFEKLISELSSRFINLPADEVDHEIEDALSRICDQLGLDLAVLWQWSVEVPGVIVPTHFHPSESVLNRSEPMSQEDYPWYREQMLAGRTVVFSSVDELPAEASVDRESGDAIGIRSNLCLPLLVGGGQPIGALSLNTLRRERDWPRQIVGRLQLVAQVFTNALSRRRSEVALRRSEKRLAAGASLAGLGFYEVDLVAGVVYADDRFLEICGVPAERKQNLQPLEFWLENLHSGDRQRVMAVREQLHEGSLDPVSIEYRFLNPTDGERWLGHVGQSLARDAAGKAVVTSGVIRDITEIKRAEGALRSLSRRLIRAHEEERALLARELHDDVTQRLAVLAIDVGRAELAAVDAEQRAVMGGIRDGLVRLSEDVHTLAYQLHPSVLDELGLNEALRTECGRAESRSGVRVVADLSPEPIGVGKDAALCLFRVAQESLNNMNRHASARSASVNLRPMEGGWLLAVRDDGVGFDPETRDRGRSLGLASMRERIRLVNGTLDIESAPGQGTCIVAWVPGEEASR